MVQWDCKPGSVPPLKRCLPFIYCRGLPQPLSSYPPAWTSSPLLGSCRGTTLIAGLRELSTSSAHSPYVATRLVGSCPTFSPLPVCCSHMGHSRIGGHSLLRQQTLASLYRLGSGVLCVARTFLSPRPLAKSRPAASHPTVSSGQR